MITEYDLIVFDPEESRSKTASILQCSKGVKHLVTTSGFEIIVDMIAFARHHFPCKFNSSSAQFWEIVCCVESNKLTVVCGYVSGKRELFYDGKMPPINIDSCLLYCYKNVLMLPSEW